MSNTQRGRRSTGASSGGGEDGYRSAASHLRHSIAEIVPRLINTAILTPDAAAGRKQLAELMSAAFQAKFGGQMTSLDRRIGHARSELEVAEADLARTRETEAESPEWVPTSRINHGRDASEHEETPFRDWAFRHKVEAGAICAILPVAFGASIVTAQANLIGSGSPVFLENPVLSWTLPMIIPISAWGLKSAWHGLKSERTQKVFTEVLHGAAALAVGSFVLLFADQYHGLGTNPLAGGVLEPPTFWDDVKSTGFVVTTLFSEMLVSCILAHRLDRIAATYSADFWRRNLENESLQMRIEALEAAIAARIEALADLEGDRMKYDRSLKLQVEMATLTYDARRERNSLDIL